LKLATRQKKWVHYFMYDYLRDGGKKYSIEQIKETGRVVSEVSPNFLAALTLILEDGVYNEFM
jgi:hypothetical protein